MLIVIRTNFFIERESRSIISDSLQPHGLYSPWNSRGQNTGVGSLSLLQGIFPTQGLHPGLPHCRRILYQLSRKGSPWANSFIRHVFASVPTSAIFRKLNKLVSGVPAHNTQLANVCFYHQVSSLLVLSSKSQTLLRYAFISLCYL